jgi:tetratricopeptide (TPR) repeat protein
MADTAENLMTSRPAWWRNPWLGAAAIAALVLAVYWTAFGSGFTWDDNILFTDNPVNKLGDGWLRVWYQKPSDAAPDYYPVTYTLIWLQYQVWGADPSGYHAVSILLHIVNCLLLWRVLSALRIPAAWLVAALFAVHPVNVPSVAWAAEQKNIFVTLLYLGVVLAWFRFEDGGKWRWYAVALGLFALGLLCKTTIVVLPPVLLLLVWWRRGRIRLADVLRSLPFWGLAVLGGIVTMAFQYRPNGGMPVAGFLPVGLYIAGKSVWFYILRDLWPACNCAVPPAAWNPWTPQGFRELWVADYLPLLMVVVAAGGLWWAARRRATAPWARPLFFAFAYFLISMGPLLGFFPTLYLQFSPVADHWQYLSLVAVIALPVGAGAWLVRSWGEASVAGPGKRKKKAPVAPAENRAPVIAGTAVAAAVLLALVWLARDFAMSYRDNTSVWLKVMDKNPAAWVAYSNYGRDLAQRNDPRGAARQFEKALELHPVYVDALHNLSVVYLQLGELEKASQACERAVRGKDMAADWLLLGQIRMRQKKYGEALTCFNESLRRDSRSLDGWYGLSLMQAELGRAAEAVTNLRILHAAQPDNPMVANTLAWLLATSPEADVRNPQEALALAEPLAAATGDPLALDTLAAAQAAAGDCAKAAETAGKALTAAENNRVVPEVVERIRNRFRLYQSGTLYQSGKSERLQTGSP